MSISWSGGVDWFGCGFWEPDLRPGHVSFGSWVGDTYGNSFYGKCWQDSTGAKIWYSRRKGCVNNAPIFFQVTGEWFRSHSFDDLLKHFRKQNLQPDIGRIDLRADFEMAFRHFDPVPNFGTYWQPYYPQGKWSGWVVGRGGQRKWRFYDKARERKVPGPWWRLELELHGDYAKALNGITNELELFYKGFELGKSLVRWEEMKNDVLKEFWGDFEKRRVVRVKAQKGFSSSKDWALGQIARAVKGFAKNFTEKSAGGVVMPVEDVARLLFQEVLSGTDLY